MGAAGKFLQQMDPIDGTFTDDTGDYSPAALVFMDFTWRLAGVRQVEDTLEWNVRPPAVDVRSSFTRRVAPTQIAEIRYASGRAELLINEKVQYVTSSVVRLVTSLDGGLRAVTGIAPAQVHAVLQRVSGKNLDVLVQPNATQTL